MSVCKMFVQNLMKKCLLASAGSEKKSFCQCHLTLLCLFDGNYATLESCLAVRFSFVDIGALR